MRIYLDIETLPDQRPGALAEIRAGIRAPASYKKAESIAAWLAENADTEADTEWRRTALDGGRGELFCIGFAIEDAPVRVFHRGQCDNEAGLILGVAEEIASALQDRNEHSVMSEFIGHNISWDLRFLWQRTVANRLRLPIRWHQDARPGSDKLFDTMTAWAGYGGRISLERLCRALNLPSPKGDMDGSRVWDYYQNGRLDEIAAYCAGDVETVRTIHARMRT